MDIARDCRQIWSGETPQRQAIGGDRSLMHPLTLLLVVADAVFLVLGVPISFALVLCSLLVIWVRRPAAGGRRSSRCSHGINAFTLLALPFFFLAGNVMTDGGISERLVKLAMAMVGHLRGGLAHVNVVVGMFLSGISGSSTADAAAIGSIFSPAMKQSRLRRANSRSA